MTPGETTGPDYERFVEELRRQRERYEQMIEATREQNRLIASSDMDGLLRVLQRKNRLLAETDEIEKRAGPLREKWKKVKDVLPPATVRGVEEEAEKTKGVLRALLSLEEEAREMMEKQKTVTGSRILEVQKKKRILDAYGKRGRGESRFYDRDT